MSQDFTFFFVDWLVPEWFFLFVYCSFREGLMTRQLVFAGERVKT